MKRGREVPKTLYAYVLIRKYDERAWKKGNQSSESSSFEVASSLHVLKGSVWY